MIKFLKFICEKVVIVEFMLLILYLASNYFNVTIPYITDFITTSLIYLTPISIITLILYIIFSILDHKFIKILLAIFIIFIIYMYYINRG